MAQAPAQDDDATSVVAAQLSSPPLSDHLIQLPLRDSSRSLQLITDALPVLVAYIDAERRYRFANLYYERWFKRPRAEFLGKHMREALGDEAYARLEPHVNSVLAGRTVNFQTQLTYRHAGDHHIDATYVPHVDEGGEVRGFVVLVRDLSEHVRLQQVQAEAARRNERLMKVTSAVADAVTREQVFEAVVDQVAQALEATTAGLWLRSEGADHVALVRSLGYPGRVEQLVARLPLTAARQFPALDAMERGEPVWIPDRDALVRSYPRLAKLVDPQHDYRIACLPLLVRGRALGALAFSFERAALDGDDERHFLMLVARYCGQAIERLRLLETEQRSRAQAEAWAARMELLSHASQAFTQVGPHVDALLKAIPAQVTERYASGCALTLLSEETQTLEVVAMRHRVPEAEAALRSLLGAGIRLQEGLTGRVVKQGETLLLARVELAELLKSTPPRLAPWLERHPPSSMVLAPLRVSGRIIGSLCATRDASDGRPFSEEDRSVLEQLAVRAASAIESARLHRDNRIARARAEVLHQLTAAVIRAKSADEVYEAALAACARGLDTERAAVLVYDDDDVLRFRAWSGLSEGCREALERLSLWPRSQRAREPVLVEDVALAAALEAEQPLLRAEGIGALATVPLVAGELLLGQLLVSHGEPRALSSAELELAKAIANHVATALARFAQLEELQRTVRFNEMFTGILGHDLRNPLGAILTAAQLVLKRSADNEKIVKPISRILSSGSRMARMIDQLLDLTRVRVGAGIPIVPRQADLLSILKQVIDELDDAYPDCPIKLEHDDGDTAGYWDVDRLSQVFSNLVANAVQHGDPAQGVRVRVDATGPAGVRAEVQNHGLIPASLLPKMFEPMAGTDRRHQKSHGLGLGLYITREIIRAHGGRIEVRSSEEDGTTFSVFLPRGVPNAAEVKRDDESTHSG